MFDGESVRCVGTVSISNGKRTNLSICEGVAKNGSKRLTRFQYDADGKLVHEEVAGAGTYEGMVTTGTAKGVVPEKEIQPGVTTFCNQLTGTYKLKLAGITGTGACAAGHTTSWLAAFANVRSWDSRRWWAPGHSLRLQAEIRARVVGMRASLIEVNTAQNTPVNSGNAIPVGQT